MPIAALEDVITAGTNLFYKENVHYSPWRLLQHPEVHEVAFYSIVFWFLQTETKLLFALQYAVTILKAWLRLVLVFSLSKTKFPLFKLFS